MIHQAPGASAAPAVAAHPPLPVAITTIGVIAVAMVGSTISSQLVDLDIADIGGGFSLSADDASWIACVATMAEVVSIPIAAILVRALSLRRVAVYSASLYVVCACLSLLVSGEDGLIVLRAMQSYCSGTMSVLMFVAVVAILPPGFARNIGLALFAFASTAPTALNASAGARITLSMVVWRHFNKSTRMLRRATRLAFERLWLTWERRSIHVFLSFRAWTQLEFGCVV